MRTRRLTSPIALGIAGVIVLVMAAAASANHPRPKGATPIRVSLVPAFNQCAAPNRTHGPPLAFPACNPPGPASSYVTVGTPDANGAPANSASFVQFIAHFGTPGPPDDDENILINMQLTDLRCKAGTTACGNANATGGPDYTGEVQINATLRWTDHFNGVNPGGGTDPATTVDFSSPVTATCSNTADTSIGGSCTLSAFNPGGPPSALFFICNCETKRGVMEFGQISVNDGGADGVVASDPQDNTVFMRQGVFIP